MNKPEKQLRITCPDFLRRFWPVGLFLLLFCFTGYQRYSTGQHYLQTAVALPNLDQQSLNETRVWVVSPFGTARELIAHPGKPQKFIESNHEVTSPISRIAILSPGDAKVIPRVELRCSDPGWYQVLEVPESDEQAEVPEGLPRNVKIFSPKYTPSRLPIIARECCNWGGDVTIALFSMLHSLSIVLLAHIAIAAIAVLRVSQKPGFVSDSGFWKRMPAGLIRTLAIILLLHQGMALARVNSQAAANPLSLAVLAAAVAALGLLLAIIHGYLHPAIHSLRRHPILLLFVILPLLGLKFWLSGPWPWHQTNDYRLYFNNGQWMLHDQWEQMSRSTVFDPLYIERSLFYGTMSAYAAELIQFGDVILNVAVLCLTSLLLWRAVHRVLGAATAAASVFFFNLYSDVFFGVHFCRHENPFLLILMCSTIVIVNVIEQISCTPRTRQSSLRLLSQVLLLAILTTLIEIQRRHGVFLKGTIGLAFITLLSVCSVKGASASFTRRFFLGSLCIVFVLVSSNFATAEIREFLVRKCGPLRSFGAFDYIAASETASLRPATSIENMDWLEYYASGIPESARAEFNIRKIVFDKRGLLQNLKVLASKDSWLGRVEHPIHLGSGMIPGENMPNPHFSPYRIPKTLAANCFVMLLLAVAVARIWSWESLSPVPAEWVLTVYSGVAITAILLFGNSEMPYDQCMAFPLAINLARVLKIRISGAGHQNGTCSVNENGIAESSTAPGPHTTHWLLPGIIGTSLLLLAWGAFSAAIFAIPGLTFAEPTQIAADPALVEMQFERQALCLHAKVPASADTQRVQGTATFQRSDFSGDYIRFLISRDQRRLMVASVTDDHQGNYSCLVNDKVAATGRLSDLVATARFVTCPLPTDSDQVQLKLVVELDSENKNSNREVRFTAEFFH